MASILLVTSSPRGAESLSTKIATEFVEKLKHWMPNHTDPSLLGRALVQAHRATIKECRNTVRDTKATLILAEVVASKYVAMILPRRD